MGPIIDSLSFNPRKKLEEILFELDIENPSDSIIHKIEQVDFNKFLRVIRELKEKFNYEYLKPKDIQLDNLLDICGTGGDVLGAIGALAESDLRIGMTSNSRLTDADVTAIKKLSRANPDRYAEVVRKLKEEFGYKGVRKSFEQFEYVFELSKRGSNVLEAIEYLSNKELKGKVKKLNEDNVGKIYEFTKKLNQFTFDEFEISEEDSELFISYFDTKNEEEQKHILKDLMNCKYDNEEVIAHLDQNYSSLVREVGFKL